jgi:hypothetical protein
MAIFFSLKVAKLSPNKKIPISAYCKEAFNRVLGFRAFQGYYYTHSPIITKIYPLQKITISKILNIKN